MQNRFPLSTRWQGATLLPLNRLLGERHTSARNLITSILCDPDTRWWSGNAQSRPQRPLASTTSALTLAVRLPGLGRLLEDHAAEVRAALHFEHCAGDIGRRG